MASNVDAVDTQPMDVMQLETPPATVPGPLSPEASVSERRAVYQRKGGELTPLSYDDGRADDKSTEPIKRNDEHETQGNEKKDEETEKTSEDEEDSKESFTESDAEATHGARDIYHIYIIS